MKILACIVFAAGCASSQAVNANYSVSLVEDINPGSDSSYPSEFTSYDGDIYFKARHNDYGYELFKLDMTTEKASLVADINEGTASSYPTRFIEYDGKLYFFTVDTSQGIVELRSYDSTTDLISVLDTYKNSYAMLNEISNIVLHENRLYYGANKTETGEELYSYDPSSNKATLIADINPGNESSEISSLISYNGKLYFDADDGVIGRELMVYDDETDSVNLIFDTYPGGSRDGNPRNFTIFNKKLFWSGETTSGSHLFSYDSATETTQEYSGAYSPLTLIEYSGKLYMKASRLDLQGGMFVLDESQNYINPLSAYAIYDQERNPSNFIVFDEKLFLSMEGWEADNDEVFHYDIETDELTMAYDLANGRPGSYPENFFSTSNKLFFSATPNSINNVELYVLTPSGNEGDNESPSNDETNNGKIINSSDKSGGGTLGYGILLLGFLSFRRTKRS